MEKRKDGKSQRGFRTHSIPDARPLFPLYFSLSSVPLFLCVQSSFLRQIVLNLPDLSNLLFMLLSRFHFD